MRIRRLVLTGFGPFAHRQEVDFAALDAAGLFLITGRTGSGKSSLLDAVCFALYGSAPRYEGSKGRLRSDHAQPDDPTRVELEFDAGGERWRVVRCPEYERPKKRGEGTTLQREDAQVHRLQDGEWVGLAARPVDVAEVLEPVLQLSREQFLQVILLAQGRFQQFLRARSEDRVTLLRALFGTERFERFEQELVQRAKALEQAVAQAGGAIDGDLARLADVAGLDEPLAPEQADGVVVGLRDAAEAAAAAGAVARDGFTDADRRHAEQVRVAGLQRRRREATEALRALDGLHDEVAAARTRRAAALRALPVTPAAQRARRSADAAQQAALAREAAQARVGGGVADPAGEAAALEAALGSLAAPLAEEAALPRLRTEAERADAAVHAAEQALGAAVQEEARIPEQRAAAAGEQAAAAAAAAVLPAAREAVERAAAVTASARRAHRLRTARQQADRALAAALAEERDAADAVRRLVEARLAGAAGLLAETLVHGSPCPVCGAAEHPAPAARGAQRVDDEAVSTAQQRQDAAVAARLTAAEHAGALQVDLAAAEAAAGGLDAEQAQRAEQHALEGRARAEGAQATATRLTAALESLDEQARRASRRVAEIRDALADAERERVRTRSVLDAADERVRSARQDDPTVAARASRLRGRLDLLRRLDDAARAWAATVAEAADDAQRLAAALQEAGFADVAALRQAALGTAEREALDERIRRHDDARAAAAAQLGDPEVAAASAEPADVAGAEAAKQAAWQRQHEAAGVEADLAARAGQATLLARRVAAAAAAVADDRERLRVLAPLAAVVRGGTGNSKRMRLEAYVLAARLEQIVAAANLRLATMTDGKYTLRHDDGPAERNAHSGLGLEVMDEHTGRSRSIASLSGGETFLASLALALGLAEVVSAEAGGVRLDTLFVDEGFGSLDRQTLDTAMETLDSLRAGGRVVGLISHVEAMQEDIPAGLHVERGPDGTSTVRLRAPVPVG